MKNKGQISKTRLENFSDGVIAILITILVLELEMPEGVLEGDASLWEITKALLPQLASYGISFFVIATYLVNHHNLFYHMKATNHNFTWLNIFFLFFLSLIAFPTALVGKAHNHESAAMLLIGIYFLTAVAYKLLEDYGMFKSGLYESDKTKKELKKIALRNWFGPLINIIAFGLIFIDFRISLILIFATTLIYILPKTNK